MSQGDHTALQGRRIVVTGATGFVGARVCRVLIDAGAQVHGVSRTPGSDRDIHWWSADLADPAASDAVIDGARPDTIIHLASHVTGARSLDVVAPTTRANLLAAINVLTAAAGRSAHGGTPPRVVLAGSMEEPTIDDPTAPGSPYAAAKAAASGYARLFHELYHLPVVNLRVFMVYGPGQSDGTKLVPYVIQSLLSGQRPRLSRGTRAIDWVYVDDVAAAFVAAVIAPDDLVHRAAGVGIDIGSGASVTVRSIVEQIAATVAAEIGSAVRPQFAALADRPLEREPVADLQRARTLLGWTPRIDIDEGLRRTVQFYHHEATPAVSTGTR